jgi:predicted nucleotidyltransferase
MAHARAWGEAAAEYLRVPTEAVNAPNVILGAEYIRAIGELGMNMQVQPVERRGGYHDLQPGETEFASATAIRAAMAQGRMSDVLRWVPAEAGEILQSAGGMHAPDDLLLARLRMMTEAELAALPDVAEGLEKRVKKCAAEASGREELLEMLKCKRYTRARLSRLTAHALLGLTAELAQRHPLPEYARLVGMRDDARPLLKELKARATLPIVSDAPSLAGNEIFQLECRATDLRALQCNRPEERRSGQEFTRKFVRV